MEERMIRDHDCTISLELNGVWEIPWAVGFRGFGVLGLTAARRWHGFVTETQGEAKGGEAQEGSLFLVLAFEFAPWRVLAVQSPV
jgi:hypothetical protein